MPGTSASCDQSGTDGRIQTRRDVPTIQEQALRAFRAIERLDPDGDFQSQPAHRAVNSLIDKIKTPRDKEVHDILSTWLAELEVGRMEAKAHPSWKRWMKAEVECQSEAMYYFGGLTEEGKKEAAQKTCLTTAKELHL